MEELAHAISGGTAAVISSTLLHPLETIRTHIQSNKTQQTIKQAVKEILHSNGLQGMYAGLKSSIVSAITSYGIYFCAYKFVQNFILSRKPALQVLDHVIVSLFSSAFTITVNNPIWVINTRNMKGQTAGGVLADLMTIVKEEGFQGLFKGYVPSMVLSINPVIQFVIYEVLKKKYEKYAGSTLVYFLLGAFSKLVATLTTFPLLTIKTRMQLETSNKPLMAIIMELLQNEGIIGLYKGLSSKIMQTVSNTAILMALHEKLSRIILRMLIGRTAVSSVIR